MKKTLTLLFVFLLSLSLVLTGCLTNKKPAPKPAPPRPGVPTPGTPSPTPEPAQMSPSPAHAQATKVINAAEKVEGVESATAVISGSTATVGLEIKSDVEAKKTDDIKTKVADEIKRIDSSIKTINITTDPDLITRIEKVALGIKNGKQVTIFKDELDEITRRLSPKTKSK